MTDHKITHTHTHRHRVSYLYSDDLTISSEPHVHEHGHTSLRESFKTENDPAHLPHFHTRRDTPIITRRR